jgi:16S rRNA (adenine1518-N6/adenine1519-N6)-dimethyltransferase
MRRSFEPSTWWEDPRTVARRHGALPQRSFSQNFLTSRRIAETIVQAAVDASSSERVIVEIGAGLGTLTQGLALIGPQVVAIELDRAMLQILGVELASRHNVRLVAGDAARIDYRLLSEETGNRKLVMVGNLPYASTGSILRALTQHSDVIGEALIMVQREVAGRVLARPGTRMYGALSVFSGAAFRIEALVQVSPGSFFPPPKVASTVLRLVPLETPRARETPDFQAVVHAAFGTRRKTMKNALSKLPIERAGIETLLQSANIEPQARAETLSVEQFAALTDAYRSLLARGSSSGR